MDHTTQLALRALVSTLRKSGALNPVDTVELVNALADADTEAGRYLQEGNGRYHLRALCIGVAKDAGISSPIKHAVPPARGS